MEIPFVDLRAQYHTIKEDIDAAIAHTLENTSFILGPDINAFEQEFADYCAVRHCVTVNSGTSALFLILKALGIGEGDEVITQPNSFFATAEAISTTGAEPRFVDAHPDTLCMDPALVEAAITPRTKAVIPVHLFGHPAELDALKRIADAAGIALVEDACQGHGALFKGQRVGSCGHAAAFSFYPGKNLGAYGDGGAVTTNDAALAERIRLLRDHGSPKKYVHDVVAYNMRLDGLQGAILRVKLPHLDAWNAARRRLAAQYSKALAGLPVRVPRESGDVQSVYHVYAIRTDRRDQLREYLEQRGVHTNIHYPIPIHMQSAYAGAPFAVPGRYPVSEDAARTLLSLPLYPELTDAAHAYVIEQIRAFYA